MFISYSPSYDLYENTAKTKVTLTFKNDITYLIFNSLEPPLSFLSTICHFDSFEFGTGEFGAYGNEPLFHFETFNLTLKANRTFDVPKKSYF